MVKKIQYVFILFSIVSMAFAFVSIPTGASGVRTIVIDAGHGGKDPGCQGALHKEKDVSLSVALKLGKFIEDNFKGVKVIYTRTTDIFVELEDRAQVANKAKADLFISIHCNAAGKPVLITDSRTGKQRPKTYKNKKGRLVVVETTNPVPYGTETYVMGLKNEEGKMKVATRENSAIYYEDDYEKKYGGFDPESEESYIIMSNYTSAYVIQSASLAMKMQDEYFKKAGRINRGVHRQSIWVLWRTSMPSILTEIGYLTNPLEEAFLGSEKGQDYVARAMFRGLRKYKDEIEGIKKEYNDEFENQPALENENIVAGNIPVQKKEEEEVPVEKIPEVKPELDPIVIGIKKKDTLKNVPDNEDSVLSAKQIAEKFKRDHPVKPPLPPITTIPNLKLQKEIVFKVQFASSDEPLNLKHEKFSAILNADFYKSDNVLKYTSGSFFTIDDAVEHKNFLRKKGFNDCFVIALRNGQRMDINEARKILGQ